MYIKSISKIGLLLGLITTQQNLLARPSIANLPIVGCWHSSSSDGETKMQTNFYADGTYDFKRIDFDFQPDGKPYEMERSGTWEFDGTSYVSYEDGKGSDSPKDFYSLTSPNTLVTATNNTFYRCTW
ncbi:MAG: hypothetical protein RLZZ04_4630 [Cyanobacteriota bacterium]|jgi:hypothetical protein